MMHVHGSTHRKGHTLDVLLTRCTDEHFIRNVAITDKGFLGHSVVSVTTSTAQNLTKTKYRKLRAINVDIFRQDMTQFRPEYLELLTIDKLVSQYNATIIIDNHVPLLEKYIRLV